MSLKILYEKKIIIIIWQAASLNQKPFDEGVPKPPWVVLPLSLQNPPEQLLLVFLMTGVTDWEKNTGAVTEPG